jgi:hypothetical protein
MYTSTYAPSLAMGDSLVNPSTSRLAPGTQRLLASARLHSPGLLTVRHDSMASTPLARPGKTRLRHDQTALRQRCACLAIARHRRRSFSEHNRAVRKAPPERLHPVTSNRLPQSELGPTRVSERTSDRAPRRRPRGSPRSLPPRLGQSHLVCRCQALRHWGWRFSRKAQIPSCASAASALSAITSIA